MVKTSEAATKTGVMGIAMTLMVLGVGMVQGAEGDYGDMAFGLVILAVGLVIMLLKYRSWGPPDEAETSEDDEEDEEDDELVVEDEE